MEVEIFPLISKYLYGINDETEFNYPLNISHH